MEGLIFYGSVQLAKFILHPIFLQLIAKLPIFLGETAFRHWWHRLRSLWCIASWPVHTEHWWQQHDVARSWWWSRQYHHGYNESTKRWLTVSVKYEEQMMTVLGRLTWLLHVLSWRNSGMPTALRHVVWTNQATTTVVVGENDSQPWQ